MLTGVSSPADVEALPFDRRPAAVAADAAALAAALDELRPAPAAPAAGTSDPGRSATAHPPGRAKRIAN
jgi:hypothetical protein